MLIEPAVVKVFEAHHPTFERCVLVPFVASDLDTLLKHVCGLDARVSKPFLRRMRSQNPELLRIQILLCFEVWVLRAILNHVALFFAALALKQLICKDLFLVVFIVLLENQMLLEFAA